MFSNFSFLNTQSNDVPQEIALPAVAIYLSDTLNKQNVFWDIVLSFPTPSSFNQAGGIGVRQFVEVILMRLGPVEILKKINPVLFDPNSNWESLGLKSLTEEFVGSPLTSQNKEDLISILNQASHVFLSGMVRELMFVLGNVNFGYGYGYAFNDLEMENLQYGYGVGYSDLDYFNVIQS